jgi:hypothetical protein
MAVYFQKFSDTHIRAYSSRGKYLIEHPSGVGGYAEAVNKGRYVSKKEGYFDNGNTYTESEIDIPVVEEPTQETK